LKPGEQAGTIRATRGAWTQKNSSPLPEMTMTDRERWTVYPLIFLTLGIALRSKITQSLDVKDIDCETLRCSELLLGKMLRCGQLRVETPDGKVCVLAAAVPDDGGPSGELLINGPNGKPQLGIRGTSQGGFVESRGTDGRPQVVIRPTPLGGSIESWFYSENGQRIFNFPFEFIHLRPLPADSGQKPPEGGKPDQKPMEPSSPPNGEPQQSPRATPEGAPPAKK
jgi:hypothetical protein